ncbi:NAD-dependent epimerase/dehydratase family protein [Paenibacillus lentus]|uniref:NAD-dependent epimerase/dehydratase family protein n=1 Tax=Paenibacillus lentus TaxID=1338368 RepID=UPI00364C09F0
MKYEDFCVVVIGGTGFVGQKMIEQLNRFSEGRLEIRALVRDTRKIKDMPNLVKIVGSLPDVPSELFSSKPHVVIHFGTKNKDQDGKGFEEVNVVGTRNIMANLPESTLGVIYGSSFSVYGQGSLNDVNEKQEIHPETPLAISRAKAENIILEEMKNRGRSGLALRPRFIIGKDDQHTIPLLIKAYQHHFNIGTGKQASTYIDVEDYARIITELVLYILRGAENNQYFNTALNVGYQRPMALAELHEIFSEALGYKRQFYIPISESFTKLLHASPIRAFKKLATTLELGAFSHSADVTLLRDMIGSDIIGQDPRHVVSNLLQEFVQEVKSSRME